MRLSTRLRTTLAGALMAWYVVTYGGQRVAGPFALIGDCTEMAKVMAARYHNISTVCRSF